MLIWPFWSLARRRTVSRVMGTTRPCGAAGAAAGGTVVGGMMMAREALAGGRTSGWPPDWAPSRAEVRTTAGGVAEGLAVDRGGCRQDLSPGPAARSHHADGAVQVGH